MNAEVLTVAGDPYLLDFVKNNILCLVVLLSILKGLAVAIPGVEGNRVFKLIRVICSALVNVRKSGNGKGGDKPNVPT